MGIPKIEPIVIRGRSKVTVTPDTKPLPIPKVQPQVIATSQKQETFPARSTNSTISPSKPEVPKEGVWDKEIAELEHFFNNTELPSDVISLLPGQTITDVHLFLKSHLVLVKVNNGKRAFLPHFERLQALKRYIVEK